MSNYQFPKKRFSLDFIPHFSFFRKKKKSKHKKKDLEEAIEKSDLNEVTALTSEASTAEAGPSKPKHSEEASEYYANKTKAEIAFLKKKEERDVKRIKEKAQVSHKDRVEKFNDYLNSLSEHYEPAKVSWTK